MKKPPDLTQVTNQQVDEGIGTREGIIQMDALRKVVKMDVEAKNEVVYFQ